MKTKLFPPLLLICLIYTCPSVLAINNITNLSLCQSIDSKESIRLLEQRSPKWLPLAGYINYPGYKWGITAFGGIVDVCWCGDNYVYQISEQDYREPTWAIHCGLAGKTIMIDEDFFFRLSCNIGLEMAKTYNTANATGSSDYKTIPYFNITPLITINCMPIYFMLGYNFVPKFDQLDGLLFGIGFSLPLNK